VDTRGKILKIALKASETIDMKIINISLKRCIVIFSVLLFVSCASTPQVNHAPGQGGEYVVASWYGKKFNGRPTASGERFDMYAMTCAHKTFRFGTKLRVTNPDNNKSVVVTVNDRGPFIKGRTLDLSYGAAKKIGMIKKGVGRVKMEYLSSKRG
jgi:rare lipoprotein A